MTIREIFRSENIPVLQNKMFDSELSAQSCPSGDVVLAQNLGTGLVSNIAFDASLLDYDSYYQNEQACSAVFRQHIDEVTKIVERHCRGKSILEIGCGKGKFLEHLVSLGHHAFGIDPAYEGNNPSIVKAHFGLGIGLKGDCIVLRHVLEHTQNPLEFLAEIARETHGRLIYIEVPCFEWICSKRAWFDIFYEHVNYFSLNDFFRFFELVFESGHLFGGQYVYVVADLASLREPRYSEPVEFPSDFFASLEKLVATSATQQRRAIWGAAAKGMMFALYMGRAGAKIECAIDINPAKQGKFLAGSGLAVSLSLGSFGTAAAR